MGPAGEAGDSELLANTLDLYADRLDGIADRFGLPADTVTVELHELIGDLAYAAYEDGRSERADRRA